MVIRPVTDLRNHFPEVEKDLKESGELYLTKNGYGSAVLLSIEEYTKLKGVNDIPGPVKKKKPKSDRGIFRRYADPELISAEKHAGREYVMDRIEKYVDGGRSRE